MSDGHCLKHAFEEMVKRDKRGEPVVYVQGTVTNPKLGRTFPHAWVETQTHVIDPTVDLTLTKKQYYLIFSPKKVIRVDPFTTAMLVGRGFRFFTAQEIKSTKEKIRELDRRSGKKR